MILGLLNAFDDVLIQPFMPDGAVAALDVGVLLRLTGLDVLDANSLFLSPFQQLSTDILGAIINPNSAGFSAAFDDR